MPLRLNRLFPTPTRYPVVITLALLALTSWSVFSLRIAAAQEKQPHVPTTCGMSFADVSPSEYFYAGVHHLYCGGAVSGYGDNTFRPFGITTRAQVSKMAVLAEALPIRTAGGPHFGDVPPSNPFYAYIETAYLRGMITGYADGTFRPGAVITRGQLAKMIVVAEGWPLLNPSRPTFSDVPSGSPFYRYVETAVANGVITGYADGTFRPGNSTTRGQIAKMLYQATAGGVLSPLEQQTVDLINARRAAMGLGAMRLNLSLTSAARRHSNDIGPAGLCQHNGTDGTSPWDRIAQAGYSGGAMGEVVGCGYTTALGVVDGWWGSPGHYAILTDRSANEIGCGWWVSTTGAGWQTCNTGHSDR
jgi:uncharacterized protein YkwD